MLKSWVFTGDRVKGAIRNKPFSTLTSIVNAGSHRLTWDSIR